MNTYYEITDETVREEILLQFPNVQFNCTGRNLRFRGYGFNHLGFKSLIDTDNGEIVFVYEGDQAPSNIVYQYILEILDIGRKYLNDIVDIKEELSNFFKNNNDLSPVDITNWAIYNGLGDMSIIKPIIGEFNFHFGINGLQVGLPSTNDCIYAVWHHSYNQIVNVSITMDAY